MRDHHDRRAAVLVDREEEIVNLRARRGVEVARRLVGQDELRLEDQRARQGHALLLAARELAGAVGGALLEAHFVEQRSREPLHLALRPPLDQTRHHHVFQGVELRQEVVELEDEADRAVSQVRQAGAGQRGELLAGEADGAGAGDVERPHAVQKRGFPRAGRADDGDELPLVDREVDPFEHVELASHVLERLADVLGRWTSARFIERAAHHLRRFASRRALRSGAMAYVPSVPLAEPPSALLVREADELLLGHHGGCSSRPRA